MFTQFAASACAADKTLRGLPVDSELSLRSTRPPTPQYLDQVGLTGVHRCFNQIRIASRNGLNQVLQSALAPLRQREKNAMV